MEIEISLGNLSKFQEIFAEAILQGLGDAADKLAEVAQDRLNRGYPPASKPGEYLARRSGDGRRSVFSQALMREGKPVARCGTSNERLSQAGRPFNYMAHWQLTQKNKRPWLSMAAEEAMPAILAAFEQGVKDALGGFTDH